MNSSETLKISLAAARVNAGLTQDDVAREFKISKQTIVNWEKHQNIEALDKIREQTKIRVQLYRQRKQAAKLLERSNAECNVTGNVTVTQCNATEKDKDTDIDKDREIINNHNINGSEKDLNKINIQNNKINNIYYLGIYSNVPISEAELEVLKEEFPETYMDRINARSTYLHERSSLANSE